MSGKAMTLLLDTNVWLACYLPQRLEQRETLRFIALAREHGIKMLYTAGQAKDIFYLVGQEMKNRAKKEEGSLSQEAALAIREYQWASMKNLRELATTVAADEGDIWAACSYRTVHSDLEDNLIFAAAERSKADFIITNDEGMMKHSPVATLSPAAMTALLEAYED